MYFVCVLLHETTEIQFCAINSFGPETRPLGKRITYLSHNDSEHYMNITEASFIQD